MYRGLSAPVLLSVTARPADVPGMALPWGVLRGESRGDARGELRGDDSARDGDAGCRRIEDTEPAQIVNSFSSPVHAIQNNNNLLTREHWQGDW